jgi:hypothetical protein
MAPAKSGYFAWTLRSAERVGSHSTVGTTNISLYLFFPWISTGLFILEVLFHLPETVDRPCKVKDDHADGIVETMCQDGSP